MVKLIVCIIVALQLDTALRVIIAATLNRYARRALKKRLTAMSLSDEDLQFKDEGLLGG